MDILKGSDFKYLLHNNQGCEMMHILSTSVGHFTVDANLIYSTHTELKNLKIKDSSKMG